MTTKLEILYRSRPVAFGEAVQQATQPNSGFGTLEDMRAKADAQDAMMARLLMVQFGQYQDEYTEQDYYPTTDAEKLAFVLGGFFKVVEA